MEHSPEDGLTLLSSWVARAWVSGDLSVGVRWRDSRGIEHTVDVPCTGGQLCALPPSMPARMRGVLEAQARRITQKRTGANA